MEAGECGLIVEVAVAWDALLKVVRLALVVLCIESSVVPAGARSALQLPVCKLSWAAAG